MKKLSIRLTIVAILSLVLFTSCRKNDSFTATGNDEIHLYIWRAMNGFYLWQENVPDLDDNRFGNIGQLYEHYSNFASPSDMFQSILYQPGTIDRFSWIVDDYVALENSFQGINQSNGMEFGLIRYATNTSNVFGYVRYVLPNSDADIKGVTRGMIFTEVDGTQLTDTNFRSLLFGDNANYTINLADYNNGDPIANSTTISLTKAQLQENPVHIATTITDGAHKIGYLMYNQFASTFDGQLNNAFSYFQSENITDLIIDLRYNGGGSVRTATFLGGMVTGQFNGELFSKEVWNSKVQAAVDPSNFINNFTNQLNNGSINEPINSLNLTRVFFITSSSTASASELVMNSLDSYIDVQSVGTTTTGKIHGSVTLYDSDNFTRNGANLNPNHTWAIQPLVLEIQNSNGSNAPGGIVPTVNLSEDYGNLGVLGERSDPLLDRTIILITTGNRSVISTRTLEMDEISNSQINKPTRNNMYSDVRQ